MQKGVQIFVGLNSGKNNSLTQVCSLKRFGKSVENLVTFVGIELVWHSLSLKRYLHDFELFHYTAKKDCYFVAELAVLIDLNLNSKNRKPHRKSDCRSHAVGFQKSLFCFSRNCLRLS